jgi:RNA polymerase sigma factor (sigma-70 family)
MTEDAELLRRYVRDRSEAAFAELVNRRVDLVYAVALRQVGGDEHLAEDVTQRVFADLARKAKELSSRVVLSGWLYRSAQFAAADVVRSERRRRERENESYTMHETLPNADVNVEWKKLRPVLDEVLGELDEEDRDAVALRFFEERSFADVGHALRLSEDAARKRVTRALDKLHGLLARRGVSSTTAAVGLALANQAGVAAPAELAAAIVGGAFSQSTVAGTAAAGGTAGFLAFLGPAKFAATAVVVAAAAIGFASKQAHGIQIARAEITTTTAQQDGLQRRLAAVEGRLAAAQQRMQTADADIEKLLKEIRETSSALGPPPGDAAGVAFVIDTSGSMRDYKTGNLWPVVFRSIGGTLAAYPDARFFIVFDSDGRNIFSGRNEWLTRTAEALQQMEQALQSYKIFSESNPVPGIVRTLRLSSPAGKGEPLLHLCVIGDEFTDQPEPVLRRLSEFNPLDAKGNRPATISAIQLPTTLRPDGTMANTGQAFQAVMTEVAKEHAGSFTLLPETVLK